MGLVRLRIYRRYNAAIQDPIIGEVRDVLKKEKATTRLRDVEHIAGVSQGLIGRWFDDYEPTISPQSATVGAVMAAMGYERRWVKKHSYNLDEEVVLANKWWQERNAPAARRRRKQKS